MSTVGRTRNTGHDPGPFTDVRTVVITLISFVLAGGAGLSAAAMTEAVGASPMVIAVAAIGAGGTSMVLMVAALHKLIRKD